MKTQRRHELRENDLAQSIELLTDSVKRNSTTITIATVAILALIVVAVMWLNHRKSTRNEAWQAIADTSDKPEQRVARLREVAQRNVDPAITAIALQRAGDAAVFAMNDARDKADRSAVQHWADEARPLYQKVVDEFDNVPVASVAARMGLAYLAEERGAYDEARGYYQDVLNDSRFKDTPYVTQAQFRLNHLDQWKTPVVFAPASAPATAPVATTLPAATGMAERSDVVPVTSAPASTLPAAIE